MFVIVCGGDYPGKSFVEEYCRNADFVIAADRGAQYCRDAGFVPDLIIGDMDSIDPETLNALGARGVEVMRASPEKDETDTGLAVNEALARGADCIRILAATGDRPDHTLANIHVLMAPLAKGVDAMMVSPRHDIFLMNSDREIRGHRGLTVSILPFGGRVEGVNLRGFKYALENAVMEPGRPYGISNEMDGPLSVISLGQGTLVVMLIHAA